MAKNTQTANILLTMDGKQAEKWLEILAKKSETLRDDIRSLNKQRITIGLTGEEAKKFDALKKEYRDTHRQTRELAKQLADVSGVINKLSTTPIKAIKDAIKAVTAQMERLDRGTEKYAQRQKQLKVLREELDRINVSGKKNIDMFDRIGATMKRLASYVLVYAGFNELTRGLRSLTEINARLSDQMADIEKTTGIYGKSLQELGSDIRSIDTRTSVEELNKLAYTAGKLGITGKENVLGFVKAANQINVALGEDLGEDAIKNIAKLNDVLGITKQLGVERSLLATGSAINELGQNSTASEGYLVDFAQRLGGVAAQAGITVQQILALASASDQMGQNVEVSATALNKVITTLLSKTSQVAKAIGVTTDELKDALSRSTWEGLMLVFDKLAGKGGLAAIAPLMGDLGSDGARLNAVISALASNTDKMNDALVLSNKAFAEATSLTAETMKKEESLMGIWDRSVKKLQQYFQTSPITNHLKDIAVYVYRVTSDFDEMGNRIGGVVNILATFVQWLIKLGVFLVKNIDIIASLSAGFIAFKVATISTGIAVKALAAITSAYNAILSLWTKRMELAKAATLLYNAAVALAQGNIIRARAAMVLFNRVLSANPFVLAATALASVGAAIYTIYRRSTEAARQMATFRKEMNQSIASEQAEAQYLFNVAKQAAQGTDERRRAIEEINTKYKDYLPNLLTETSSTSDLSEALKRVNEGLKNNIAMKMKQADVESLLRTGLTSQLNLIDQLRNESSNTDTMDQRMIDRANELISTYSDMGASATKTFLTVQSALMNEFGESAKQSSKYWAIMNDYVVENINQRDKLTALDKKYAPFSPKEKTEGVSLPEVVVTAPLIPRGLSDSERKDAINARQKEIDLWLQQKKNALTEARLAEQDANSESYISQEEYNRALESLEMEALKKRLSIIGLEPEEIANIEGQILEIRKKFMELTENAQSKWVNEYNKLQEQLGIRTEDKDKRNLARINILYDTLIKKAKEGVEANYKSQEQINADIEKFQSEREKAIRSYWGSQDLKSMDETESKEKNDLKEQFINREIDYEEYLRKEADLENQYAEAKLFIEGLTEEQLTELRKKQQDIRFNNMKQAFDKEKSLQKQYASIIESSLDGLGGAFAQFFSNSEDGMAQMKDALIDTLFESLEGMVDIWLKELDIAAAVNIALGSSKEIGSKGLLGIASAALVSGAIHGLMQVAKSAIKKAIKGKKETSSSTGQRVVKSSGYSVGGYSGDGGTYEVAGIVHKGEYIVPKWQMQDPVSFDYVRALETIRQSRTITNPLPRKGYAEGGPAEIEVPTNQVVDPEMKATLKGIQEFLAYLKTNGVYTNLNVSNLNKTQERLSASRARGSLKK